MSHLETVTHHMLSNSDGTSPAWKKLTDDQQVLLARLAKEFNHKEWIGRHMLLSASLLYKVDEKIGCIWDTPPSLSDVVLGVQAQDHVSDAYINTLSYITTQARNNAAWKELGQTLIEHPMTEELIETLKQKSSPNHDIVLMTVVIEAANLDMPECCRYALERMWPMMENDGKSSVCFSLWSTLESAKRCSNEPLSQQWAKAMMWVFDRDSFLKEELGQHYGNLFDQYTTWEQHDELQASTDHVVQRSKPKVL